MKREDRLAAQAARRLDWYAGIVIAVAIIAAIWATTNEYGELPESLPVHVYAVGR